MNKNQSIALFLLLALTACDPKVDNRGYVKNMEWKDQITIGQTTREQVLETFGSPSTQSAFGEESWYYITARKEAHLFFKPQVVEQDVVRIVFDASGVVSAVENYDKTSSKDFDFAKRTTPTEGHQLGFIEQTLGNIGRFNKPGGSDSIAPSRRPGGGSPY